MNKEEKNNKKVYLTKRAYQHLMKIRDGLLAQLDEIHKARKDFVDSSTKRNGEDSEDYDAAREESNTIERIKQIDRIIKCCEQIVPNDQKNVVLLGNKFTVRYLNDNTEKTFILDGASYKLENSSLVIGTETPLGQAVYGRSVDEEFSIVHPKSTQRAKVVSILGPWESPWD